MSLTRQQRRQRRRTRLTLLASALVVAVAGVAALYHVQKNRQHVPVLDTAPRDAAVAMVERGEYKDALTAFEPYLNTGQTTPAVLVAWAEARLNVPLPDGAQVGQAVGALRSVLRENPHHTAASLRLLEVLSRYPAGVENEIINLADRVLEGDPENADARRARALGLASHKRYGDAARTLDAYLVQRPGDLQMQRLMLDMMRGEKQPDTAVLARARRVRETAEDPGMGDLVLAHADLIAGDRTAARTLLKTAAQRTPSNARLAMQTVQMLDAAGVHVAVLPYLERCVSTPEAADELTRSPELVTELVLRRFESGRVEDALELLAGGHAVESLYVGCVEAIALHTAGRRAEAAQRIRDLNAHATNRYRAAGAVLAAALPEDGASADAQAVADAARGLDEHAVRIAYLDAIVADAFQRRGQTAEAEAAYLAALQQRPAWAGPCLGLAGLYLSTGDEARAYRYAVAAGEREGRSLRVAVMTARAAGARVDQLTPTQLAELAELIEGVQRARPGEPATAVLRVDVLARQGRTDEAAAAARAAARLDPPLSEDALLRLGVVARAHQLDAQDELEAAYLDRFGQTPRIAMTRAAEAAAGGDPDQAVAAFDTAVPDDAGPEWRVNRALLYERVGHPDTLARWAEAADSAPGNTRVQTRVLTSPAVWTDRALADRTIERLQAADPDGVAWRTERSRYLLTDPSLGDNPTATAQEVERLLSEAADGGAATLNVLVMQATARRLQGDPRGAAQLLEKAVLQNPDDPGLQLELAQTLGAAGDRDRALDATRRVARRDDLSAASRRSAARLLGELGDRTAAAAGLDALRAAGQATPADLLALARLYRDQQRPDAAAALVPDLLAGLDTQDVGSAEARADAVVFAADVYAAAGRPDDASAALDRLDGLGLTQSRRLTLRAAHAASRGRLEEAAEGFAAATRSDPSNPAGWRNLVEFRLRSGQRSAALDAARAAADAGAATPGVEALRAHSALIDRLPDDPDLVPLYSTLVNLTDARGAAVAALLVLDRYRDGPPEGRADALVKLADEHPRVEALEVLAVNAQRRAGRTDDALRRATAAADRFPRSADLAQALAEGHARRRNWSQTLIATDAWRARVPGGSLAADTLAAQAHRQLDRPDRAIGVLAPYRERILDRPESTPVLTRQYAILLAMAGRTQEARSLLEPLLSSDTSGTYWRMTWLDVATQGVRDTRDAGAWLQQVEGVLDESQLVERSAIAQAWWALGRRDKHPPYLERARTRLDALAADPDANADVWFFLGTIAEHDGQPAVAAERYRRSLELSPEAENVRNNLAMVLANDPEADSEQLEQAIALATAVVQARPDEPNFLDTKAAVLLTAGRHVDALEAIRQAIELDPGNPDWRRREDQILASQADG